MDSLFNVGVHAVVFLSHKARTCSSDELAENICTNPARVRKVMAKLKKSGLVTTKEGNVGGYAFNLNPSEVTLDMIADALEVRFVDANWKSGDMEKECLISSGMGGIMESLYLDLDRECRNKLKKITIKDLEDRIFKASV